MSPSENEAERPVHPESAPVAGADGGPDRRSDPDLGADSDRPTAESPGEAPAGTIPPQPAMPNTSETMPAAEGVYAPEGDRPD
ncbi:MAG TPA: hypothetical protein VFX70_19095 [Mycobacteriales bacterium]|nr:hypothetical protein [Mycobacteriales bacterium]